MNPDPAPTDDALEELTSQAADEYMERLDRGEQPDVDEFVGRHPQIAGVLRRLLPALQAMREEPADGTPTRSASEASVAGASGLHGRPAQSANGDVDSLGRLGDFQIVREIGRGGMGVVYEAVQLSLGRRVALKVLPFAAMLDPQRLQRFQNEARAAACLHHGNIVPIYAVGADRGVHFYAMQYIEGRNFADLVRDARVQAGLPPTEEVRSEEGGVRREDKAGATLLTPHSSLLTPAAAPSSTAVQPQAAGSTHRSGKSETAFCTAAALALQAAEALHHAHQQGVVHRDVKPANILVDAIGHVWVTDFGLAQVQSDPRLTTTGALVGTLRYMSPEQAAGDQVVDHRTDIYSLGVTLYELLSLHCAFGGSDRADVLRRIGDAEPRPLRRINPAVPTDLETIVAKATAKSAADRYATAQALADDLRRFLDDQPILAKRPSLLDKAAKWARRRRGLVMAAVVILLLAVCGSTTSTLLIAGAYEQLANEQKKTKAQEATIRKAYEAESEESQRAHEAAARAREVLYYFTQVAEEEFPKDKPELQPIRRKLLEAALGYYKDFLEEEQGDDPSIQAELNGSRWRIVGLLDEIGQKQDAAAMFNTLQATLPSAPGGFHWPGMSVSGLLTQPALQKDLKLTAEQKDKIAVLTPKRREIKSPWEMMRRIPGDDGRRTQEEQEANEKACVEVLRPEQAERLKQIILQKRGPFVLSDADVADALQLTQAQRDGVSKILYNFQHPPSKRMPDFMQTNRQLIGVLTDDQKATWKELQGEPFQGDIRFGFQPPPSFGFPGVKPGGNREHERD